jgi:ankyrin repeat protein
MKNAPTFFIMLFTLMVFQLPALAHAFDVGPVIDRARMSQLVIAPDERALAIGGEDALRPYVVTLLGESTFFIDQYGADQRRTSRSPPLPVPRCTAKPNPRENDPLSMGVTQQTAGIMVFTNPCPTGDTIFYLDRDANITSFIRPIGEDASDLDVTVWDAPKPDTIEANLTALFARYNDPSSGKPYAVERFVRTILRPQSEAAFMALVNRPRASFANREAHFQSVRDAIAGKDWRATSITSETLNNAAFYLSEGGSCADLGTAVAMLRHVVATNPTRRVANLNLADAYAKARTKQCNNLQSGIGESQEAFRLYCTGIGLARVPRAIRARYRDALVTPQTETGTKCQPQFAMQRAILAGDRAALARALADPENVVDVTFPNGNRALGLALERKRGDMARMILAAGGDPDRSSFYPDSDRKYEFTPMTRAIWNYDVETVGALAAKGKSALDFSMRTSPYRPLLTAAALRTRTPEQEAQKLAIMDLILTLEPSPLDTGDDGRNAFYAAADGYSSAAVFERLARLGVYVNKPDQYGRTPLFAVAPFAWQEAVRTQSILLGLGANPNQQNNDGQTPLVHAFAWSGASDVTIAAMVTRLLEAGADTNIADSRGHTALNLAAMRAMPDTVDLLIAKGAKLGPTPRYETSTIDFVKGRIADLERDPTREADCTCMADYKRILAALNGIVR